MSPAKTEHSPTTTRAERGLETVDATDGMAADLDRQFAQFEAHFDYSMDYAREVASLGSEVFQTFHAATQLGEYRQGVSVNGWYAAKLLGVLAGDCGSCVQLVARMAEGAGVPVREVAAVVSGDFASLSEETRTCADFVVALLSRTEALEAARERARDAYGTAGLVTLAFAAMSSSLYPTLKYALGHAHGCTPIAVGGETVVPVALDPAWRSAPSP